MKLKVTAGFASSKFHFPVLDVPGFDQPDTWSVTIKEVTQGDVARYRNLTAKVAYYHRASDGLVQEQQAPSGDLMFERAACCVSGWNLEDEKGNVVEFGREAWNQLPPLWADFLDGCVVALNPELVYGSKNQEATS